MHAGTDKEAGIDTDGVLVTKTDTQKAGVASWTIDFSPSSRSSRPPPQLSSARGSAEANQNSKNKKIKGKKKSAEPVQLYTPMDSKVAC